MSVFSTSVGVIEDVFWKLSKEEDNNYFKKILAERQYGNYMENGNPETNKKKLDAFQDNILETE